MSVKYNEAAREEGFEAAAWYAEQQADLQTRFLEKWRDAEKGMSHRSLKLVVVGWGKLVHFIGVGKVNFPASSDTH